MVKRPYSEEEWAEVKDKTSSKERLLWEIFGSYPSLDELRARTPEEVGRIQRESDAERQMPLKQRVTSALDVLTAEERRVIELRFGIKDGKVRTVEETISELTYSPEGVEHIEAVALQKLRLFGNILDVTQSSDEVQDLDEMLRELEPKEGECLHPEQEETVEETHVYSGSALGPFEVHNAKILKCKTCGAKFHWRLESHSWEIEKAKELLARGGPYVGNEVRFLWSVTGLSLSAFAAEMSLSSDIVRNREQLVSWENSRVPEGFEEIFVRHVRHWLEREEVWINHLKQQARG